MILLSIKCPTLEPTLAMLHDKTKCYEYNFCSLKERNEVQHIYYGISCPRVAWLKTPLFTPLRQMTCGDVCAAPPAHIHVHRHSHPSVNSRSSPSPAAQWGNIVLYLVPLLQETDVIFITFRSLSVDSLGTTHILWDMYTRPAEQPPNQSQTSNTLVHRRPSRKDRVRHWRGCHVQTIKPNKSVQWWPTGCSADITHRNPFKQGPQVHHAAGWMCPDLLGQRKTPAAVCYGDSLHNPVGQPLFRQRLALSRISKTYKQLVA